MTGDEWVNYYTEAYKYKNGVAPASVSDLFGGNQDYVDAYNAGKWIDWVDQAMDNKATTQNIHFPSRVELTRQMFTLHWCITVTRDYCLMRNSTNILYV